MSTALRSTNQHYVTKAYLDKFVHPTSAQAVLYPYRKGGNRCKARGTSALGSAQDFYWQRQNGELNDNLDEARKVSETLLFSGDLKNPSSLFKCVTDDSFRPSESDRLHLATAAAFLFCSAPVQIHNSAMFRLLHHQFDLLNWHNTDEAKAYYRERFGDAADERREADRNRVLKGELFIDVGRENWKQLGFSSFEIQENMMHEMLAMKMTIVDCHYRCFFVTSDNPAVAKHPSAPDKRDEELWFPISHNRGVLWHRRPDLGQRTRLGYSKSHAMNRLSIRFSYKFVYSPLSNYSIETATKQETHNPMWGHYGSLEKVIDSGKAFIDGRGREVIDLIAALKVAKPVELLGI